MDDFEAILAAVDIVDEEVDSLLNRSLEEQSKKAPVTTPTVYELNVLIGSSNLYQVMQNQSFNRIMSEISEKSSDYDDEDFNSEMAESLDRARNFRTYLTLLIYHFLEVEDVDLFRERPPPLMKKNKTEVIDWLREEKFEWEGSLEENPPGGVSQPTDHDDYTLIWIYFLPEENVKNAERNIRQKLRSENVRDELVEALSTFPQAVNMMARGKKFESFFDKVAMKAVEALDAQHPEFKAFDAVFLHEITHDYLKHNTENSLESRVVDEAFAQFTDKVYLNGLDFNHSPQDYEYYRDYYDKTDPENIWWMTEIIREKAKTLDLEGAEYSVIDWARMAEAKIHNQDINTRTEFLEFFTPEKLRGKFKKFNSVIENELRPLFHDIEENFLTVMDRNHEASLEKQRELKEVLDESEADIERLEEVLSSPDKVLRRAEKIQIGDQSKNGKVKNILKMIEFYIASNNETLEYEKDIIHDVLNEELKEIKACIDDFGNLAGRLEAMDENETAQKLVKDIRKLEETGEKLQIIKTQ